MVPQEVVADRGFDQSLKKQERCRKRWGIKRLIIPKKGKRPHPHGTAIWFKRAVKKRTLVEPVIGHIKNDHRMNCCRDRGITGDTANVVWATIAVNTKKITLLQRTREKARINKVIKRAA